MAHEVYEVTRTRIVTECLRVVAPNSEVATSLAKGYGPRVWQEVQGVAGDYHARPVLEGGDSLDPVSGPRI